MVSRKSPEFRVLFVCLGNICRSPTAEGVFRHLLAAEAPLLEVVADSAGTADYHVGKPPDPRAQAAAAARGIDLSGLRARQVTTRDFAEFDLILAMDADNLKALRARRPAAARAQLRLFLTEEDVPDPYYGGQAGFEKVLDLTAAASRELIRELQQRP